MALMPDSRRTHSNHRLPIQHDGQFAHIGHAQIARRVILSQASALVSSGKSVALIRASRAHQEGRIAIVTNVGCGMRWTPGINRRVMLEADERSRVVLVPRRWDQALSDDLGATVANKPGTPRRPRISCKPSRRECRLSRLILW